MRIVITGAAGRIGKEIVEELSGRHELCLIDRRSLTGRDSHVAELSKRNERHGGKPWLFRKSMHWSELLSRCDAVVHLAASIEPSAPWEKVLPDNIESTWNLLEAAANHDVPRVVFASSNWAVKALERKLAPDCYRPDGPKIASAAPPWPVTAYGVSKAFGEIAGRMFVDEGKLKSFIAVRIGYYDPQPGKDKLLRTRWVGSEDIRSLLRRCVEEKFEGYHVVYGVSAQPTAPYDLSHTRGLLSWEPTQLPE